MPAEHHHAPSRLRSTAVVTRWDSEGAVKELASQYAGEICQSLHGWRRTRWRATSGRTAGSNGMSHRFLGSP